MPKIATESEVLTWIATRHGKEIALAFWQAFGGDRLSIGKYREPKQGRGRPSDDTTPPKLPWDCLRWLAERTSYTEALEFWREFGTVPPYIPVYRPVVDPVSARIAAIARDQQRQTGKVDTAAIARQLDIPRRQVQKRLAGPLKLKQYLHLPDKRKNPGT